MASKHEQKEQYTVLNDSIHGTIKLRPIYMRFIDTPQFQRLRNIQQLGVSSYVFPSATHTRFEHSIGVCHLAEKFAQRLQTQLKEENSEIIITDEEVQCVAIAGLCHDLGHGPFSHLWETFVKKKLGVTKKHEELSVEIFQEIWKNIQNKNNLNDIDKNFFQETKNFTLISDLILPPKKDDLKKKYPDKLFLFEIVNNEENKVDVDKWDYFERDCHYLGTKNSFDHRRLMEFFRLVKDRDDPKKLVLAYKDNESLNIFHMFYMRWYFHNRFYQHRTVRIIEDMFMEAFMKYGINKDNVMKYWRKDNHKLLIKLKAKPKAEAEAEAEAEAKAKAKAEAKEIMNKIDERTLYELIETDIDVIDAYPDGREKWEEDFKKYLEKECKISDKDAIYLSESGFDFGKKEKDPVEKVRFYSKRNLHEQSEPRHKNLETLPKLLHQIKFSCISKNHIDKENKEKVRKAFRDWIEKKKSRSCTNNADVAQISIRF